MGVNVADEPSDFTHRLEPEAFPDGDVVSQKRVAGRIRQVADLLTNSEGWKQRVSEHPMFQLVSDAMTSPENWSKVQEAYPDIESPEQFEARLLDFVRDSITANNAPRLAAVDVPSEASSTLRMDNPAPADADTLTGAAGTDTLTGMPIDTTDVGDDPPQRS